MRRSIFILFVTLLALRAGLTHAQTPAQQPGTVSPAMERVTFDEAVRRALERNPTVAQAATAILRAEALLQQAKSGNGFSVSASATNVLIDTPQGFGGTTTQPRDQVFISGNVSYPILAASQWAATNQTHDQIEIAKLSTADVRQQIAVATAQTYLAVIAQQRQVEVNTTARASAETHLDYAQRRLQAGAGSRLNQLRAAQELSADDARLEQSRLGVRRAQEALGVLLGTNGPVDANGEPTFDPPGPIVQSGVTGQPAAQGRSGATDTPPPPPIPPALPARTDIRLAVATRAAAERVLNDSSKDWYPSIVASFNPQFVTPSGAFTPAGSWRFTVTASQPIFDGGSRKALKALRDVAVQSSRYSLLSTELQALSEVRLAEETVRSTERTLTSVRLSAEQAAEVLTITTTAFEAGATTNLEVIDAQRQSRDAASAVAIAEDALRRARLDLLTALGQFPRP